MLRLKHLSKKSNKISSFILHRVYVIALIVEEVGAYHGTQQKISIKCIVGENGIATYYLLLTT